MDPVDGVLRDEKKSKYTIVATLIDGIDSTRATAMAAEALSKYPNAKCFVGLFAYNTPSILKALAAADKLGKVRVVGFDANEGTLEAIEAGHVEATIMQDAYGIGFQTVRTLADVSRGDKRSLPMFQTFFLSADPVTKANVAAVKAELAQKRTRQRGAAPASPAAPAPAAQPPAATQPT
jgi:ribose transport system substrate-binding protein